MPQPNGAQTEAPQFLASLPDDKIVVERQVLRQILALLSFTTPIVGEPATPDRWWSGIKSLRLYKARRLLRRAIAEGDNQQGGV